MAVEFVPGLAGVPATESAISFIDGTKGVLEYRGTRIEELTEKARYPEVAYLLFNGSFPNEKQLADFSALLYHHQSLDDSQLNIIRQLPRQGHPMHALMACVATLGMMYEEEDKRSEHPEELASTRIMAKLPTMLAAFHRIRSGNEPVAPRSDLDYSGNILWMITGKEPSAIQSRVFDTVLTLHADHTMNASTFASRVTGSTLADAYSVIASGIGTLKGPLHGGANEAVLVQLREIGSTDKVREWVETMINNKERIMGLGHRVYKVKDPRAVALEKLATQLFEEHGSTNLYDIAREIEKIAEEKLASKGIYPNVDFFSGIVYEKLDVTPDLFTPLFAISRTAGWLAHWHEQRRDNKLFRPSQIYVGERDRPVVPMTERPAQDTPTVWQKLLS